VPLMKRQRWIKRGVGTLLAAVAILLTGFPPPALPLRWIPAGAALVLAIMLFWEQRPVPDIPPDHAAELRKLGRAIQQYFSTHNEIAYGGETTQQTNYLRTSFQAHFPGFARQLNEWDELATDYRSSMAALEQKAKQVVEAENLLPGAWMLLANTAGLYVLDQAPPVAAFNETANSDKTTTVSYGVTPVANLNDPTPQEIAHKKGHVQNTIGSIGAWPEVNQARTALAKLETLARMLAPEAARISLTHDLTVVSRCPICPH
jgi:hypothetical protein